MNICIGSVGTQVKIENILAKQEKGLKFKQRQEYVPYFALTLDWDHTKLLV